MGKVFIFDMGEVLILNVKNLQAIAKHFGLEYKSFREFYGLYDKALMEGKMEDVAFLRILEKKYNIEIKENLFISDFHPLPNPFIMEIIQKLREKGLYKSITEESHKEKDKSATYSHTNDT